MIQRLQGDNSLDPTSGVLLLNASVDVVLCRQLVRRLTERLRFSALDQTKMMTAASELSRNTVVYGLGGEMQWDFLSLSGWPGLRLSFDDKGPGIADVDLALTDGWTSGAGMGFGLSGSRRLVDEFDIRTAKGLGTCVTITKWNRGGPRSTTARGAR